MKASQKASLSASPLNFYINACKSMRRFLRSMNIIGMNNIVHDITFGDGQISILTPDLELVQFYSNRKIPLAYTNSSGRFLDEGIYLYQVIENQYPQHTKLVSLFLKTAEKMNLSYGKNYIHYVIKEQDCQHMYTIFFDLSHSDFLHLIVNNGNLIKDTIEKYHQNAQELIAEAKSHENRLICPDISHFFQKENESHKNNIERVCLTHKKTQLPIHLSLQRGQCLLYLTQGKSIKEIACSMNLSAKTIEHYLELLRKELGCRSSRELIAVYGEQLANRVISPY